MTDHLRHQTGAPRALLVSLVAIRAAALGALLSLLVAAGLSSTHAGGAAVKERNDDVVVQRAMTSQRCSPAGFGASEIPASALVRTPAGEVRVVSFEHGWDIYQGRRPGALIAVCLRDLPQH